MARTPHPRGGVHASSRTGARIRRLFRRGRFVTALTALVAVWVLASAWALGQPLAYRPFAADAVDAHRNEWLVGVVVLLTALLRWFRPLGHPWASVLTLLAGVWLAVSPLVLDYGAARPDVTRLSDLAAGTVLALLGLRSLLLYRRAARTARAARGQAGPNGA
ncbi:MAG TPA: hypothetical protein VE546_12975 [Streptomyces sp.]|uniref:SPW repeat domain-containing protein n=1 Tax=Streptomyces sp. TaxID=1931 RepID=UPI002D300977|nr:hypothetical protein [Streptomyces sp.]HZG04467.1 hypothetical protein [Streptomyces sp.]